MKEFEHLRLRYKSIKHATNNFADGNYVAEGGFGKVYRGEFYSKGTGAVKCIDRSKDQADVSFWREIMLLSSYRHENLVALLGFCDEGEVRIIVYEYAHNKSLDFHLHDPKLRWIQRLKICHGAACGLEYLHNPRGTQQRVLHRDIKSANILLDENWTAKIADFGLSKYGPANQEHTFLISDAKGTLGYCDPMYIESMILTKESDVYSFGVVLFEVLCSRPCVDYKYNDQRRSLPLLVKNCEQEQQLHTIIDINLRQQIDENAFDTFVTLAYQCLERDRTRRPTMELVVRRLESALKYQEIFEVKAQEAKSRPKASGGVRGKARANQSQRQIEREPWPDQEDQELELDLAEARAIAKAKSKAKSKAISNTEAKYEIFEVKAQEAKSRPKASGGVRGKARANQSQRQIEREPDQEDQEALESDQEDQEPDQEDQEPEPDSVEARAIAKAESKAKGKAIANTKAISRTNDKGKAKTIEREIRTMSLGSRKLESTVKDKEVSKFDAQEGKSRTRARVDDKASRIQQERALEIAQLEAKIKVERIATEIAKAKSKASSLSLAKTKAKAKAKANGVVFSDSDSDSSDSSESTDSD